MRKRVCCWIVVLILILLGVGCGGKTRHQEVREEALFALPAGAKIKVEDVVNDTGQVSSVDMIGLFWVALENALKEENLLWIQRSDGNPLNLEAHILEYEEGHALQRWLMPGFGSTVLHARVDLRNGSETLGSFEAHQTVSLGDGFTTIRGWEKVFAGAAKDIVEQIKLKAGS